MVKLSIITPTYNSILFIESCIQNVIKQNNSNVEHIIVDALSSDGTVNVIKEYAKKHSHIKWVSEKDSGQSNAMNKGIAMASGELLGFLNVDDYYEDGVFTKAISLSETLSAHFFSGNCNVWSHTNELTYVSKPKDNTFCACYFRETYPINPASYFYRKSVHNEIGLYDEQNHLSMDLDFFLRYMNKYKTYYYEDAVWGNFRLIETCKTYVDSQDGNMLGRKKELFKKYWRLNSTLVRYICIIKNKLKIF